MTQATGAPPDTTPPGRDTAREAAREALATEDGPLPRHDTLTDLRDRLLRHITALLPPASVRVSRMWQGGCDWYGAALRLDAIRERLTTGPGEGLASAHQHVLQLARDVEWLLARTGRESPAAPVCCRCHLPGDLQPVYDPPGETRAAPTVVWCRSCREGAGYPDGPH